MSSRLFILFLIDGKPDGMRSNRSGAYFLLDPDLEDPEQAVLYIGKGADPIAPWLRSHPRPFETYTGQVFRVGRSSK